MLGLRGVWVSVVCAPSVLGSPAGRSAGRLGLVGWACGLAGLFRTWARSGREFGLILVFEGRLVDEGWEGKCAGVDCGGCQHQELAGH